MPKTISNYSKYSGYIKKTLKKPSPKVHDYIYIGLNFGAILFFGWFAIRPTLFTITKLINEINTRKELLIQIDDKIESLQAADTSYKTYRDKLYLAEDAIPAENQAVEFASQLEYMANQSGVDIKTFEYEPYPLDKQNNKRPAPQDKSSSPGAKKQWEEINFNLKVSGTYSQLIDMVRALYTSRRIVLTDKLEILPTDNQLILNVSGRILYL